MKILRVLPVFGILFAATPAFAAWQYAPQRTVTTHESIDPGYSGYSRYRPAPASMPYCSPDERALLEQMHELDRSEIMNAELALRVTRDPRVADYARRVLDARTFTEDEIAEHAGRFGVILSSQVIYSSPLEGLRGPQLDYAYLRASIDAHDRVRPLLASVKERTRGDWHEDLSRAFDDVVALREQAKPLADDIRNDMRERGRGHRYGRGDRDDRRDGRRDGREWDRGRD